MSKNLSFFKPHHINDQVEICKAIQRHFENQLSSQSDTHSIITTPTAPTCHLDISLRLMRDPPGITNNSYLHPINNQYII